MTSFKQSQTKYNIKLQMLDRNVWNIYNKDIIIGNSKKDSGFDLYVPKDVVIPPGEIKLINMGI